MKDYPQLTEKVLREAERHVLEKPPPRPAIYMGWQREIEALERALEEGER